ncbi:MAG: DUF1294 domain-containing protein [Acutalibacteraceae bacterium]|nr:DUF1294 domain-containing protein [Acutalibacteraceae bacterium]
MSELLFVYFCGIQLIAVILTVKDKKNSVKGKWRISEKTLLLTGLLGGALSMYITMLLIRHKTKHIRFVLLLPVMILLHIIVFYIAFK